VIKCVVWFGNGWGCRGLRERKSERGLHFEMWESFSRERGDLRERGNGDII
jgi:hypothetical protein